MPENGLNALAAELRDTPPSSLGELRPEQIAALTAAVKEARRRQSAELAAAGDKALSHIPRLLRGPIRRVVG